MMSKNIHSNVPLTQKELEEIAQGIMDMSDEDLDCSDFNSGMFFNLFAQ